MACRLATAYRLASRRLSVHLTVVLLSACSTGRAPVPESLRGYEILVWGGDALSTELTGALRDTGLKVRRAVRGGSPPTAGLVHHSFRDASSRPPSRWVHARLADIRTGVILAAVTLRLDSAMVGPWGQQTRALARALVDSILAQASTQGTPPLAP